MLLPVFFSTASRTEKQSGKEKRTLSICQIEIVDKKANHEFHEKMVFLSWGWGGGGWGEEGCFTYTSANVIYCITCTLCKKLYIGETGRRLGDRFRKHLRDVEKDDKDASEPAARHFNLPNHSKEHMSICGLSLHQGTTDSRKKLEQRFIFQIGTLNPHGINERFSFN